MSAEGASSLSQSGATSRQPHPQKIHPLLNRQRNPPPDQFFHLQIRFFLECAQLHPARWRT